MQDLPRLILLGVIVTAAVGGFIVSSLRNERAGLAASPLTVNFVGEEDKTDADIGPESDFPDPSQRGSDCSADMVPGPDVAGVIQRSAKPVPWQQDIRLFCTSDLEVWQSLQAHYDAVLTVRSGPRFDEQAHCWPA